MKRVILLQTDITKTKVVALRQFSLKAIELTNFLLSKRKSKRLMDLHREWYLVCKKDTSFSSQVICDIERRVAECKSNKVRKATVKFNVPRNCKIFKTKNNLFVELRPYPQQKIAVCIKKNGNYDRFQEHLSRGWICKTFGLTSDLQIVAYLSKEAELSQRPNILGIDVNVRHFTISVLSPAGKILYQTYLGKHIWNTRLRIMKRRTVLQSLAAKGCSKAKQYLERIKTYEKNFVKTNLGQMIREIMKIAKKFNAEIAIENLRRFKRKHKSFNRKVLRIPFYQFKQILEQRCFDNNIRLNIINRRNTSKWCSHCGALAKKGHDAQNYSLYRCSECGLVVNSDRKASLAIAVKSLLERTNTFNPVQISNRRVSVNRLVCRNDVGLFNGVVHSNQPIESHPS